MLGPRLAGPKRPGRRRSTRRWVKGTGPRPCRTASVPNIALCLSAAALATLKCGACRVLASQTSHVLTWLPEQGHRTIDPELERLDHRKVQTLHLDEPRELGIGEVGPLRIHFVVLLRDDRTRRVIRRS